MFVLKNSFFSFSWSNVPQPHGCCCVLWDLETCPSPFLTTRPPFCFLYPGNCPTSMHFESCLTGSQNSSVSQRFMHVPCTIFGRKHDSLVFSLPFTPPAIKPTGRNLICFLSSKATLLQSLLKIPASVKVCTS